MASGATAAAEVCDGAAATGAATTAGIQFTANVSGRTATGQPGQSCMETGTDDASGDVITQNLTFESYKFTVSSDGTTATQAFAGTDNYNDVTTGNQLSCLFTETAALSM